MDVTKREELEKAYRKEKDFRVILRMLAVHMVRVRKMSVSGTAVNLMRSDRWVHILGWNASMPEALTTSGIFPEAAGLCRSDLGGMSTRQSIVHRASDFRIMCSQARSRDDVRHA